MGSMMKALIPLHIISVCLGITTFKVDSKGYGKSRWRKYVILTVICFYFVAASVSAYFFALTSPSLIPQTFLLEYVFGYFQIITIWGSAIYYQDLHLELMAALSVVDKRLHKLGIWLFYADLKKYVLKRILFHVGAIIVIISLQLYTDRNMRFGSKETIFFMALFYVPIIISFGVVENIGIFINILKERFKILNAQVEELKGDNVRDSKKLDVLRLVCPIHLELTHLAKGISRCFGFTLLLTFSVNFITIMIGCYIICVAFQYLNRNLVLIVVPQTLLGIATYLVNTYYLCYCGQSVVRGCNRTGLLLHALDFEEIKFTAAGFFSVDYSLLFSIIGGLTTYIIILIQFSTNSGESINRYYENA